MDTRDLVDERAGLDPFDAEDSERAAQIDALFAELADYAGDSPEDGIELVPDSDFEDYARQLAEDCGMIPEDLGWPLSCIVWERAARELRMDYTLVTFDGEDYWYR